MVRCTRMNRARTKPGHALVVRPSAKLADVPTEPEWLCLADPDIAGASKPLLKIRWHVFPTTTAFESSVDQLRAASADDTLLFR